MVEDFGEETVSWKRLQGSIKIKPQNDTKKLKQKKEHTKCACMRAYSVISYNNIAPKIVFLTPNSGSKSPLLHCCLVLNIAYVDHQ